MLSARGSPRRSASATVRPASIGPGEDVVFHVERVACLRYTLRPAVYRSTRVSHSFSTPVMQRYEARVRAAFWAARLRPSSPFVRAAFVAARRKFCLPRVRALLRACRESDSLDAADRPSRLRAPLIARDRVPDGGRFVAFVVLPLGFGPSFTPARRAFDKPIAIACLVLRAPCLPSRIWCISSRTNSPACVVGAFPARASSWARSMVFFSGMNGPRFPACM